MPELEAESSGSAEDQTVMLVLPEPVSQEQADILNDPLYGSDDVEVSESPPQRQAGTFYFVLREGES